MGEKYFRGKSRDHSLARKTFRYDEMPKSIRRQTRARCRQSVPSLQVPVASPGEGRFIAVMIRSLTVLLCGLAFGLSDGWSAPESWTDAIAKLTQHDGEKPAHPEAVVFVGSSSIVKWSTLAKDFSGIAVIQRGFGGSELADSVFYADRIVTPYKPRAVVVYAGENDIAAGKTADDVATLFRAFVAKVHADLPYTKIYFVSLKFSPSRAKFKAEMRRANVLVAAICEEMTNCRFVDVNSAMLDPAGEPRPELFEADKLHMRPEGYVIWKKILTPLLQP